MFKKRDSRLAGDRFPSRSPQGAGVYQSDRWQATLAQVAYRCFWRTQSRIANGYGVGGSGNISGG